MVSEKSVNGQITGIFLHSTIYRLINWIINIIMASMNNKIESRLIKCIALVIFE